MVGAIALDRIALDDLRLENSAHVSHIDADVGRDATQLATEEFGELIAQNNRPDGNRLNAFF